METETAGELPNTFDGIEFRRVRGQIIEREVKGVFFSPRLVKTGMMVFRVIGDHHHAAAGSDAGAAKGSDEHPEGGAIELAYLAGKEKLPVAKPHSSKISHAVPGGRVKQDGILGVRRDPHPTSRTMLLKMHFVHGPEINRGISISAWSFFMRLLPFQVRMGNQGAGLAQAKAPLPEQTLALTHPQMDLEALGDPGAQRFSVPQRTRQAQVARHLAQGSVHLPQLRLTQSPGAA